MREGWAGGFRGLEAETTSHLGTTLKAGRRAISLDLQPTGSASGGVRLGFPNLGLRPWNPTGILNFGKKVKDTLRMLFKLKENKTFPTVFHCRF